MTQGIGKQIAVLPPVKAELHLRQIPREVLRRNLVPRSNDAALEQRKCRFDRVGMDVAISIFARRMFDGFVLRPHIAKERRSGIVKSFGVAAGIVGHDDFDRPANVLLDVLRQRSRLDILRVEKPQIATTLANAKHDFFVGSAPALTPAFNATDIGLIHFHCAGKRRAFGGGHCFADAVAQVPRGLVTHANGALELIGRHSLPRLYEQEDGEEPRLQRQFRIAKNRAGSHAKLVVTGVADQDCTASVDLPATSDASWACGPTQTLQEFSTAGVIGETRHEIDQSHTSPHQKTCAGNQKKAEGESREEVGRDFAPAPRTTLLAYGFCGLFEVVRNLLLIVEQPTGSLLFAYPLCTIPLSLHPAAVLNVVPTTTRSVQSLVVPLAVAAAPDIVTAVPVSCLFPRLTGVLGLYDRAILHAIRCHHFPPALTAHLIDCDAGTHPRVSARHASSGSLLAGGNGPVDFAGLDADS